MRRVIKIGGSLLQHDSLAKSIQSWVLTQPPAQTIAIVGGGVLLDAMRQLDVVSPSPPSWVHWQCIGLLRTTYEWLGRQLCDWQLVSTAEQFGRLRSRRDFRCYLVAVDSFYHLETDSPLPEDWTTTSDAIAGWLSVLLEADELVLLKSIDVDASLSLIELSRQGVVDSALPMLDGDLPKVRFVNFASEMNR